MSISILFCFAMMEDWLWTEVCYGLGRWQLEVKSMMITFSKDLCSSCVLQSTIKRLRDTRSSISIPNLDI